MQLHYEEDLVEYVVGSLANQRGGRIPALQLARFSREREKVYGIHDPDERNMAFFKLHRDWFCEWGMERLLTAPVNEFPLLKSSLAILGFRLARGKKDEGAELYVNKEGHRNGVIALSPGRLTNQQALGVFMRHELTHLDDMLNPGFGYEPHLPLAGFSTAQHGLARERYRLVWDITIDGRAATAGRQTLASEAEWQAEFARAFSFWPDSMREDLFTVLWNNPQPTHASLVALVCDPRGVRSSCGPGPGAPCPLCGFPSFDWADQGAFDSPLTESIRHDFPQWVPDQGVCRRCVEVYQASFQFKASV